MTLFDLKLWLVTVEWWQNCGYHEDQATWKKTGQRPVRATFKVLAERQAVAEAWVLDSLRHNGPAVLIETKEDKIHQIILSVHVSGPSSSEIVPLGPEVAK